MVGEMDERKVPVVWAAPTVLSGTPEVSGLQPHHWSSIIHF
jgi:hypothetical protein